MLSSVQLFATPWTVAHQAPLSLGFSRQEYWSGLPFPPPGDLPDPGIEPQYLTSLTLAGKFFTTSFNLLTYYYFKCPQKILLSTFNIVLPRCQEKKVL